MHSTQEHGENGRAPISMHQEFVKHVRGMIENWLQETKAATQRERDAVTPKGRAFAGGRSLTNGRRGVGGGGGGVGGAWGSPIGNGGHGALARQVK